MLAPCQLPFLSVFSFIFFLDFKVTSKFIHYTLSTEVVPDILRTSSMKKYPRGTDEKRHAKIRSTVSDVAFRLRSEK